MTGNTAASIIATVARAWLDIDYPPRVSAEEETLSAPNRFTPEALVFAVNQQMAQLSEEKLSRWSGELAGGVGRSVGVLNPGNIPFAGLQDFLAVILAQHRYTGCLSSRSPALLPAFWRDLEANGLEADVRFGDFDSLLKEVEILIASGSSDTMLEIARRADKQGIPEERRILRATRFSVAVIDGRESAEERVGLAEDMLLHEGLGCRNVALVWAPVGCSPDSYLEAMAAFRATFPSHPESSGALEMQRAYLDAVGLPHAHGEGLEFLVSRGEAEVQTPPHVRWVDYSRLTEVETWLADNKNAIQLVVARESVELACPDENERAAPGFAQRPKLGWRQDGFDLPSFLRNI